MPDLATLVEDEAERPEVEVVECLLGRQLRVRTQTGRLFEGSMQCLDYCGKLLLFDTTERCTFGSHTHDRQLNQVIIPLEVIQKVEVLVQPDDKVLHIMLEDEMKSVGV